MSAAIRYPFVRIDKISAKDKWALNGGPFGSKLVSSMYVETGVPVIRGTNLSFDGGFRDEHFVYLSPEKAMELRAHSATSGDVIITQRGTLGQVGLIPSTAQHERYVISQSQMKLTTDRTIAHPAYVYYCFLDPNIKASFIGLASSSGVPHVNLQTLREFKLPLPPLPIQWRIAGILSAYDDLIENNTRRIAILEDMARRLFEEWFVHFRFPGNDDEAPETKRLDAICDVIRGRSYRSIDLGATGGVPFVNLKCLQRDGGFRLDGLKSYTGPYKARQAIRTGDIVMAVTDMTQERRIVARCALVPRLPSDFGVVSMDLVKIKPKHDVPNAFLYAMLRWSNFAHEVKQHANGANVLHLSPTLIEAAEVGVPSGEMMHKFADVVTPILAQIAVLETTNTPLRAARDLLLPKLISGEIDVGRAETAPDLAPPLLAAAE